MLKNSKNLSLGASVLLLVLMFLVLGAMSITLFAEESAAIVGTEIIDDKLMIFINCEISSYNSVQIGNTECEVSYYGKLSEASIPAETLFLIDVSNAISEENQEKIQTLISDMVDNKPRDDIYSIMTFSKELTTISDFTDEKYDLFKSIENITYYDEVSYLHKNLEAAVKIISERQTESFKRIVLVTEGYEYNRESITLNELQTKLKESGIPIYTIWTGDYSQGSRKLASFSRVTNAISSEINSYEAVSEAINNYTEYSLLTAKIPPLLMDGGIKRLGASISTPIGDINLYRDIRLPLGDVIAVTSVQSETTATTETQTQTSAVTTASVQESNNSNNIAIIIAVIGAVAVVIVAAVIIILTKKGKSVESLPKPQPEAKPIETYSEEVDDKTLHEPIFNENYSDGRTIRLFDELEPQDIAFKLTDENDTANSFQSAIGQGVVIGRNSERCMIAIKYDKYIARTHCRISKDGGVIFIEDLNSTNGTYLNGKKISDKTSIKSGDLLKLGRTVLKFEVL